MDSQTTLTREVARALRDHGITAALTALTCAHSGSGSSSSCFGMFPNRR